MQYVVKTTGHYRGCLNSTCIYVVIPDIIEALNSTCIYVVKTTGHYRGCLNSTCIYVVKTTGHYRGCLNSTCIYVIPDIIEAA